MSLKRKLVPSRLAPLLVAITYMIASTGAHANATSNYRATVLADNPVSYWRLSDTSGSTAVYEQNSNPGTIINTTLKPGLTAGGPAAFQADVPDATTGQTDVVNEWPGNGNANDVVSGNNGTWLGQSAYGAGPPGQTQAFELDGSNAVSVGNPADLQLQNFTISAWIKRTSTTIASPNEITGPGGGIFCDGYGGPCLAIYDDGQPFLTQTGIGGVAAPQLRITDTNWHHLSVTKEGSVVTFNVDGTSETAPEYDPQFVFDTPAGIGGRVDLSYADNYFLGSIADVAISPAAASATNGLVGEWQGNANANDSIGTDNGTLIDGGYTPGDGDQQAFELNGMTSYVEIPAAAMQTVTGPISVAADIYPERISPGEEIFSQYDTHNTSTTFSLSVQAGGTLQWEVVGPGCDSLRGDARTIETTSPVLALDTWAHVAATFEPSTQTLEILVNGSPVPTELTEDAIVPSLCVSSTPLRIGAAEQFYGGLAGFDQGKVQDVQLYDTDISGSPPTSAGPPMTPGSSLPIADQPIQQVVFVHGIRANCADVGSHGADYSELYDHLSEAGMSVFTFCYDHDLAFGDHLPSQLNPARCFSDSSHADGPVSSFIVTRGQETAGRGWNGPLPVTQNSGGSRSPEPDDGDGALAYDAVKLDDCLSALVGWDKETFGHAVPIAVIGNSMGGAITRGWLRLASSRSAPAGDQALEGVTTVDFLQGAVDGSWLAGAAEGTLQGGDAGHALQILAGLASGAAEASCHGANPGIIGCLNVERAGIEDLAAGSVWNRAISGSHVPPPPHLHYFTYSTDLEVIYHVQFVLWGGLLTIGPEAVPGDGLMELGTDSYKTLPPDGGSEFLPFGAAPDQHQYIMRQKSEVSAQGVAYLGGSASRAAWVALAAGAVLKNPYSHFNFGHNIGHLMVNSCDSSLGTVSVVDEVTRVFEDPSDACGSLSSAEQTESASLLHGPVIERPKHQPDFCARCATIANAHTGAPAAVSASAPVEFYDRRNRAQLALYTVGPLRGSFTLLLKNRLAYFGVLPSHLLPGHTLRLNLTVTARTATAADTKVSIRFRGVIALATHYARIIVRVRHPAIDTELTTSTANVAAAKTSGASVIRYLSANNLAMLASSIAPDLLGGRSPQALAGEMAAQGVHITHIATAGKGSLHWPMDGNPVWLQPVRVDAPGHAPLRTSLAFEEEAGRWWLVGSTR